MAESINHDRRRFLGAVATALGAATLGVVGSALQQMACAALVNEGTLPSLSGGARVWPTTSPKGEAERFHAGFAKIDLEFTVGDRLRLTHQLVGALSIRGPVSTLVDV